MKINFKKNIIIRSFLIVLSFCIILTTYFITQKEKVVIEVRGEKIIVNSFTKKVKDVLDENNIIYDKDDIIYPSLNAKLKDYMKIKIICVQNVSVSEHSRIDYKTKVKKDKTLPKGTKKVIQEGKDGRKTTIYEEVYHDNKLVSRVKDKEIIREKPTSKIIIKGTNTSYNSKTASKLNTSSKASLNSSKKHIKGNKMVVSATAYSGDSITATGTCPRWGTIAVDPRIIPYGTKIYIPKFNMNFRAEDCGGGIKGNRIDIFMNSESACNSWGVRSIDIYIVE